MKVSKALGETTAREFRWQLGIGLFIAIAGYVLGVSALAQFNNDHRAISNGWLVVVTICFWLVFVLGARIVLAAFALRKHN